MGGRLQTVQYYKTGCVIIFVYKFQSCQFDYHPCLVEDACNGVMEGRCRDKYLIISLLSLLSALPLF